MHERNTKAVLFDLDGTLIDTIEDITAALNAALATEGVKPLSPEEGKGVVGRGLRNAIRGAMTLRGRDADEPTIDRLFGVLTAYYRSHATDFCKPYDQIPELLEGLNARKIPIGVFSNKDDRLTKEIIGRMFPQVSFVWVRGMRDDFPAKPNGAGLQKFCSKVGIGMDSLLYVGDSEVDWKAAEDAGCPHILVTWGFRGRDELLEIEGVRLADSVRELEEACYGIQ